MNALAACNLHDLLVPLRHFLVIDGIAIGNSKLFHAPLKLHITGANDDWACIRCYRELECSNRDASSALDQDVVARPQLTGREAV